MSFVSLSPICAFKCSSMCSRSCSSSGLNLILFLSLSFEMIKYLKIVILLTMAHHQHWQHHQQQDRFHSVIFEKWENLKLSSFVTKKQVAGRVQYQCRFSTCSNRHAAICEEHSTRESFATLEAAFRPCLAQLQIRPGSDLVVVFDAWVGCSWKKN